jgi:hypothetical protein
MSSDREKRRIINSCQTCRTPIYEGEPTYTSSKSQSSGYTSGSYGGKGFSSYKVGSYGRYYDGSRASESWIQCPWCYDQWQIELAINRKFWIKWWLGGILLTIIATIISINNFPGLEKSSEKIPWHRIKLFSLGSWEISAITLIIFLFSLLLTIITGSLFQPATNRYKLRKRSIKL